MIRRIITLAAALALAAPVAAAGGEDAASYAEQVAVTSAPGSSLQRLDLPARILAAARSPELADVRVFNAEGQAVPIALSKAEAPQTRQSVTLPLLPILGTADALSVTGVSLRIDDNQRASVVRVDGTPQPVGAARMLGILLDTRRIEGPLSAISLDVATPVGQPVTFTIESSPDLKDWEPLADKVIYRTSGQAGGADIGFPRRDVQGRYLRVTWQATSRLLSPVTVRSAAVVTMRPGNAPTPRVVLAIPPTRGSHVIEFTLPFAAPITALEITLAGADAVLPVRILGRNQPEQPWTPIASGSVFRITRDGTSRVNDAFATNGARFTTLRIEADARTAGFAAPPQLAVRLQPAQIVFLATGSAPFTLAAGRVGAASAFLPLTDLVKANGGDKGASLPTASLAADADPVMNALASEQGPSWRRLALWGVLLAGTALLAAMVWLLMRRREPAA